MTNSENSSPDLATASPARCPLVLKIRGCGNVVSFKNTKKIVRIKGRPSLVTDPRKQKLMDSYIRALECALSSEFQTSETGTRMGCSAASWIRSSVPADDSWKHIPKSDGWECLTVQPGEEGADIIIERLPD
jgi:hypothetical protein